MEIIKSDETFKLNEKVAATIGFFDGVHAGHRFLLEQLKIQADARKLPSMAITFLQHPQSVLQYNFQPELLNTFDERIERLSLSGVDYCLLLDFTKSLSQLNAKDFIHKKLKDEWNIKLLLIGYDHRFGKDRTESFEDYLEYGKEFGIEILQASELFDIPVSSTHIRNCLLEGNLKEANRMLSYCYRLEGKTVEGDHFGKKMGFPTANIEVNVKNKIIPRNGVYAAHIHWNREKYGGMVYIGKRPTITVQGEKRIEAHLFNFSNNLYGETLQIEFVEFIREDKQYGSFDDLKKQLFIDRDAAITALAKSNYDLPS